MRYFKYFPKISYEKTGPNDKVTAVNLLARLKIRKLVMESTANYYPYIVGDEDRPDVIAHKYYGSSDYTWIIFYANDIFDPQFDWVMNQDQFNNWIERKYSKTIQELMQETHHYSVTIDGVEYIQDLQQNLDPFVMQWITAQNPSAAPTAVSVYDYEYVKNEKKRNIKLIDPRYIDSIQEELKTILAE